MQKRTPTHSEATARLIYAVVDHYTSREWLGAALLREELRLYPEEPKGAVDVTQVAVRAFLRRGPKSLKSYDFAERTLAVMLCSMACEAGFRGGRDNPDTLPGLQAALDGYLAWFHDPR